MSSPLVRNIPGIECVSLAVRVDCRWALLDHDGQLPISLVWQVRGKRELLFPIWGRVILENIQLDGPKTALQFCLRSVGLVPSFGSDMMCSAAWAA
jgi:hypothetical protein